jgi:hypothetical protein
LDALSLSPRIEPLRIHHPVQTQWHLPLLLLFHVDSYYDSDHAETVSLVSALIQIRNKVPQSAPKRIDHQQINALTLSHSDSTMDADAVCSDHRGVMQSADKWVYHRYQCFDFEQLFGENVASLLWLDLCKLIVSFLDNPSLLRCAAVNHCCFHMFHRNNTLLDVLNQPQRPRFCRNLKCTCL